MTKLYIFNLDVFFKELNANLFQPLGIFCDAY